MMGRRPEKSEPEELLRGESVVTPGYLWLYRNGLDVHSVVAHMARSVVHYAAETALIGAWTPELRAAVVPVDANTSVEPVEEWLNDPQLMDRGTNSTSLLSRRLRGKASPKRISPSLSTSWRTPEEERSEAKDVSGDTRLIDSKGVGRKGTRTLIAASTMLTLSRLREDAGKTPRDDSARREGVLRRFFCVPRASRIVFAKSELAMEVAPWDETMTTGYRERGCNCYAGVYNAKVEMRSELAHEPEDIHSFGSSGLATRRTAANLGLSSAVEGRIQVLGPWYASEETRYVAEYGFNQCKTSSADITGVAQQGEASVRLRTSWLAADGDDVERAFARANADP
ncbi:hypothetical protein BDV98DRAFT_583860 [Pterulicium gracile]|uniref:Uncharacterized protein n=1 Tax=Pterulicium gracile TaxID=1884261 RepID=A0A5C3QCV5_9AGAR|nr:hypothetical protein BDV98DRAFT_583860 [Pterula gracilis]